MNKLIVNSSYLGIANIISGIIGLVILSLSSKSLGLEKFGILTLIITITYIFDGVINFQTWQGIIKFGAPLKGKAKQLSSIVSQGLFLDIITALLAFLLLNISSYTIVSLYGWPTEYIFLFFIFSFSILFNITGSATGICRIFDKFNHLAITQIIISVTRIGFISICFFFSTSILFFILAYTISQIIGSIYLLIVTFSVLKKENIKINMKKIKFSKKFLGFSFWTNISSTVDMPIKLFDVLLVSILFSVEMSGIYKIFKQLLLALQKVSEPIYHVIFPIQSETQDIKKRVVYTKNIMFKLFLGGIPLYIFILLTGKFLLNFIFNYSLVNSNIIIFYILMLGGVLEMIFIPLHPLFLSFGFAKQEFAILLIANLVYLIAVFILAPIGLISVAISYLIQLVVVFLSKFIYIRYSEVVL
jgi:O-antigen/teichoic acid export membrane protein